MLHRLPLALLALLLAAPAFAQGDAIEAMLRARDAEIKTIVGKQQNVTDAQRDRLRDVVNGVIDFEAMSRQALGPFWAQLSPAQRTDFVDVFGAVVRAQSLADLDLYRARVTYGDVDVNGTTAVAHTRARSGDVDAAVDYALARKGDDVACHRHRDRRDEHGRGLRELVSARDEAAGCRGGLCEADDQPAQARGPLLAARILRRASHPFYTPKGGGP